MPGVREAALIDVFEVMRLVKERQSYDEQKHDDEMYVAKYWHSLATLTPECVLPLASGGACRVIFTGYPSGAAGPDIRDAVLVFDAVRQERLVGDVEFHIRANDWVTHGHHTDPRYNNVLLHIVLVCDTDAPTRRQDGVVVPVCSLFDMTLSLASSASLVLEQISYPCQLYMVQRTEKEREQLLRRAGFLRFEQKRDAFIEEIHALSELRGTEEVYHLCLIPALAEGLAYGRDRAFFRAASLRLLGMSHTLPEPLGRTQAPTPLDESRLTVIATLIAEGTHVWTSLRAIFIRAGEHNEGDEPKHDMGNMECVSLLQRLRDWCIAHGMSKARTDIVLCNVVLPFVAAVALIHNDRWLEAQVHKLYDVHPGLVSNRITRIMTTQLGLQQEPRGACVQQGLHYIYQQTCHEKRCHECIAGREQL